MDMTTDTVAGHTVETHKVNDTWYVVKSLSRTLMVTIDDGRAKVSGNGPRTWECSTLENALNLARFVAVKGSTFGYRGKI